ncbi:hypothetical protein KHQ81_13780 [Mycoplasmatota bacterium]|nr:hypothetical protein KHQ81_13780 [Mycoplasmatota bacterium]
MAYLYEDKELVYEKQMMVLKKRIVLVNLTMFVSNFIATLILLFNRMPFINFLNLVLPVFVLNLIISYAILINKDSHEQLYLAMYISIIGTIVVMINIFINVQNPATYMLIYLGIAIIGVFKDKKAVGLGYLIIFVFGTIINFKYDEAIVNYNNANYLINNLTPYLYESILVLILLVQAARAFYNEKEIDDLYDQLDIQKEVELKYHKTIFDLLGKNQELITYTDQYVNDETKERLFNYVDLINESFYIKEDLKEKIERYLNLQKHRSPHKILGKSLGSYQLKKEISHFEEMSTYKLTKLISLVLSITYKNSKRNQINDIKNYDLLFMNPDMSIETQILGIIFLYEHLRNDKPYIHQLSHDQILAYFKSNEAKEIFGKEILEFFITNEEIIKNIYENKKINDEEDEYNNSM